MSHSKWKRDNGIRIFDIQYSKKDRLKMHANIEKIMDEAFLSNHTFCRKLEKKLSDLHKDHHFLACSSGTSALEAIFRYLNINSKAVLVQSNTFIATGHAINAAGGIIVPIDLNKEFTASLEDIKRAFSECKEKGIDVAAVCLVNIAGRASTDNLKIRDFCKEEKVPLVEDNAQGIFSKVASKYLGTIADYSAYSFHTTKIVAAGEGGAISCARKDELDKLNTFLTFGSDVKNNLLYTNASGNFKLNELSASFILMDMDRAQKRIKKRKKIDEIYKENLNHSINLKYLEQPYLNEPSFYKTLLMCNTLEIRKKLEVFFRLNKIAMTGYVYKIPLHRQPRIIESRKFIERKLLNTEKFCDTHITPPNYPELNKNQVNFIVEKINEFNKK